VYRGGKGLDFLNQKKKRAMIFLGEGGTALKGKKRFVFVRKTAGGKKSRGLQSRSREGEGSAYDPEPTPSEGRGGETIGPFGGGAWRLGKGTDYRS